MLAIRTVGFLVALGRPDTLRQLAWTALPTRLGDAAVSGHRWESRHHELSDRRVCAVQFSLAGAPDPSPSAPDVFIAGEVFGRPGNDSEHPLPWLAAAAAVREAWAEAPACAPYGLDSNAAFAVAEPDGAGFVVFGDRVGWRRLFYHQSDDLVVVSTWLRALLQLVPRRWVIDPLGARMCLATREPKWPHSIVQGVQTLPPVHRLTVGAGQCRVESYWRAPATTLPGGRRATEEDLLEALGRVVRRQLAGRRSALLLSGGYDSVFLAYVVKQAGVECETLTGRVTGGGEDETPYAARVAERLGLVHSVRTIEVADVVELQREFGAFLDIPGHDPTNMTLMARVAVRLGYDAVLQGMGGDALFGNAAAYRQLRRSWRLARMPGVGPAVGLLMRAARQVRGRPVGLQWERALCVPLKPSSLYSYFFQTRVLLHFSQALGAGLRSEVSHVLGLRAPVFETVRQACACEGHWRYLWSVWDSPAEYHADFAITGCGMGSAMPLADPGVIDVLFAMGAAAPCSRSQQAQLVGLDEGLMLPRKQGFKVAFDLARNSFRDAALEAGFSPAAWAALGLDAAVISPELELRGAAKRMPPAFQGALMGHLLRLVQVCRAANLHWSP
jgi:hypothetical protein